MYCLDCIISICIEQIDDYNGYKSKNYFQCDRKIGSKIGHKLKIPREYVMFITIINEY